MEPASGRRVAADLLTIPEALLGREADILETREREREKKSDPGKMEKKKNKAETSEKFFLPPPRRPPSATRLIFAGSI